MTSIIGKFISMYTSPFATLGSIKESPENSKIAPAMIYMAVMSFIVGIISVIWSFIVTPPMVVQGMSKGVYVPLMLFGMPLVSVLSSFIGAFLIWILIFGLYKGAVDQYKMVYAALALLSSYSPIVAIVAPIPTVGSYIALALDLVILIIFIGGAVLKTFDVQLIPFLKRTGLILLFFITIVVLGVIMGQQALNQPFGGDQISGFDDEGFDADEFNRQLQELAEEETAAQN